MSAITPPPAAPLCRITVEEYERLADSGVFDEPERIELIDGYIVTKARQSPEHCYSINTACDALRKLVGSGWTWQQRDPVRIPVFDEPEPDIAIVRGPDENYRHRHPGPSDVGLVIEVSMVTTLDLDRGRKLSAYASGGIPVYWIVNLVDRQIEVYTAPSLGAYQTRADYRPGQAVPLVIDGQHVGEIAVDDILP